VTELALDVGWDRILIEGLLPAERQIGLEVLGHGPVEHGALRVAATIRRGETSRSVDGHVAVPGGEAEALRSCT
jgi:hypothetical protein